MIMVVIYNDSENQLKNHSYPNSIPLGVEPASASR